MFPYLLCSRLYRAEQAVELASSLGSTGGSETFKDKLDFFYYEVRKLHKKHFHDKLQLKVSRDKILESSMRATKNLSTSEWCKNFEITFLGEQGLDWGGLQREWFHVVCSALFDSENQLFHRFKNDKQGLVHPNPRRPSHLKLKHYEYAGRIVGKCLYESSLGTGYRQLVKARFSRSFLAQLIGLRVHFKVMALPNFYNRLFACQSLISSFIYIFKSP